MKLQAATVRTFTALHTWMGLVAAAVEAVSPRASGFSASRRRMSGAGTCPSMTVNLG